MLDKTVVPVGPPFNRSVSVSPFAALKLPANTATKESPIPKVFAGANREPTNVVLNMLCSAVLAVKLRC